MRAVVQRVKKASVKVDGEIIGKIEKGLLALLAVTDSDSDETMKWMCNKLANLRVFPDEDGKMNVSALDCGGGILLVPNFTLYGELKKGFRPNFLKSAKPDFAEPMFNRAVNYLKNNFDLQAEAGEFGAMMEIELINDGPVTIVIDKE